MTPSPEFILLTGFLGSGKTSLLRDWLGLPEAADTALIVNEAGEINVDGAILAEAGGVPMAMLANGCVCCSLTSDLVFTIRALLEERGRSGLPPFRRVVLESSGLSRPGPILRSLAPLAPLGLRVRVVATCDASQAAERAAHFDEAAAQLAAAGTVVFTKLDLRDVVEAEALVASINPLATRLVEPDRAERARRAFLAGADEAAARLDLPEPPLAHPRVGVLRLSFAETASWEDRLDLMEDLAAFCGDRLLRVKGFIRRPGEEVPLLVQAVGTLFSPPVPLGGAAQAPEGLVVIARDLSAAELRAGLGSAPVHVASFRDTPLACSPA
ncbi:GTPase, G3E family [Roseomonas rosea]|uniref:GTPase, G3E family n=1 Tax=Muricoccus roseus TaxID=198092 RepID=A0A1M6HRN3_9PROT|nr:GTP-binding protein [Roseomonas rosea]SHJ24774.1 GTPase, G3E family [Roseomonas rosea]